MTLSSLPATGPDLLRLLAVPVFAWAAVRDIETRRVSSGTWIPLAALGAVALGWEGWVAFETGGFVWTREFLLPAAISLGFVVPIAYLFWWAGGFGGADAKALLILALLFPTFPQYVLGSWTFPLAPPGTPLAFSFTILTNAVLIGMAIPVALAIANAASGRVTPVMFVAWPVRRRSIPTTHGSLLETPDGLTRSGLDLDALRMYLRWRGLALEDVRAHPDELRNPASLPDEPNPPTDGAVSAEIRPTDGDVGAETQSAGDGPDAEHRGSLATALEDGPGTDAGGTDIEFDDPWGAEAFLDDIGGSAYGTSPERLRAGLEVLAAGGTDRVWISPGTPFLVPVFLGLVVALLYGDLLFAAVF